MRTRIIPNTNTFQAVGTIKESQKIEITMIANTAQKNVFHYGFLQWMKLRIWSHLLKKSLMENFHFLVQGKLLSYAGIEIKRQEELQQQKLRPPKT